MYYWLFIGEFIDKLTIYWECIYSSVVLTLKTRNMENQSTLEYTGWNSIKFN